MGNLRGSLTARLGVSVGPDGAAGVAEDRGGQALGDAHQAGPVHLHDQVVHLDPAGDQVDRQADRQTEDHLLMLRHCGCWDTTEKEHRKYSAVSDL